ncbi:MAG TPA: DUF2007 domain-containing protein [Thermoanaerobaculia bacterium]|nr:DUF2007 domain-containing protein [Thermoanaerobaculia bacterium]
MRYELEKLVTIETFTSPWQAQLARARLEAEGIESMVADEHLVRMHWLFSNAVGGVKLQVRPEDAGRAVAALGVQVAIPDIHLVTEEEAVRFRCPACNSDHLSFERWSRLAFVGTWLLLGIPLPIPRNRWTCRRCGAAWKEAELRPADGALVAVARFTTPWEAHLARALLESEGIDACVHEERLPTASLLSGELKALNRLEVNREDAAQAREILASAAASAADLDDLAASELDA